MAWFNKKTQQPQKKPQPAVQKPKKGKCKIKWKVGKDGSETFESTPECTDANIQRAMQMRESRRKAGLGEFDGEQ